MNGYFNVRSASSRNDLSQALRVQRAPNTVFWVGTSRHAAQFLDPARRFLSNAGWMNWAAARLRALNKPLITVGNLAVSGSRTDEWSAAIESAVASGASHVAIDGPINDIAKAAPTPFTGSISGSVLTVDSPAGFVSRGGVVTGSGVAPGTVVLRQLSGAFPGVGGTYEVSVSQTVPSGALVSTGYVAEAGPRAGQHVFLANVAEIALATIKSYIEAAGDAGQRVLYVWERGAANFTPEMIGALNDFNRLLADYLERGDQRGGRPDVVVLDPPPFCIVTNNASAIALKHSQDGTHDNVKAAKIIGFALAEKLAPHLREMPSHRLRAATQAAGFGKVALNPNPTMSGSAPAGGTGNTGQIPAGFETYQADQSTADFAIRATVPDSDGNGWGNELVVTATATGPGRVDIVLPLATTHIAAGDLIRGGLEIDVADGATGLACVTANLEWFPASGRTPAVHDLFKSDIGTDDGGYAGLVLEPPPLEIVPGFTGVPYTNLVLRVFFSGAGSATVVSRKWWAERTPA